MDDLISRQAAIDALEKCHKKCCREDSMGDEWIHYETAQNEIECVQPVGVQANTVDMVSRQAAIDYLMTNMNWYDEDGYESDDDYKRECITELINGVPSAEPQERKTGRWISLDDFRGKYNEYGYKCSECGEQCDYEENYCPNCGCKMEGTDDCDR